MKSVVVPHTWLLPMTGQPAVQLGFPLPVTFQTEAHLKINRDEPVLSFNVSVALFAVDLVPAHVRLMTEEDIIRRKEDPDPGDRFLSKKIFVFPHNLRMLWNDIIVTEKTFLNRRKSGAL